MEPYRRKKEENRQLRKTGCSDYRPVRVRQVQNAEVHVLASADPVRRRADDDVRHMFRLWASLEVLIFCSRWESNPLPTAHKTVALTGELHELFFICGSLWNYICLSHYYRRLDCRRLFLRANVPFFRFGRKKLFFCNVCISP